MALVALVLLAPVLLVVALVTAITLGRPVLFRQERLGKDGRVFSLVKLRSMTDARGPDGELLPDAQRLTAWGRFLRKSSLDELPELINVLRGEMSLVGPRPLLVRYGPLYSPEQYRRHEVLPGLTGWAQVKGRNALSWDERFRLDVWYVDHRSLLLDVWILLLTPWVMVRGATSGAGVSARGHATMPPFEGVSAPAAPAADAHDPAPSSPRSAGTTARGDGGS